MNGKRPQRLVFTGFRVVALITALVSVSACTSISKPIPRVSKIALTPDLICLLPSSYKNKIIGDGHCVTFIKHCSGAPQTSMWRPGISVLNSQIQPGAVIANFQNGRYPNKAGHHAAIYINQDQHGIWVWDQWVGKPVHQRLIRIRADNANPSNTAQAYKVVRIK